MFDNNWETLFNVCDMIRVWIPSYEQVEGKVVDSKQ